MDWTAEAIERLKLLWSEGLSTAEIGRRLNISKNAVVGKAHRLALTARPSPIRRGLDAAPRPRQPSVRRSQGPTLPPLAGAGPEVCPVPQVRGPADQVSVPRGPDAAAQESGTAPAPSERFSARDEALQADAGRPEDREPPARDIAADFGESTQGEDGGKRGMEEEAEAFSPVLLRSLPRPAVPMRPAQRNNACCWPIGEPGMPDFHFCGKTSVAGRPYCEVHVEIAYVRVRDRRDHAA